MSGRRTLPTWRVGYGIAPYGGVSSAVTLKRLGSSGPCGGALVITAALSRRRVLATVDSAATAVRFTCSRTIQWISDLDFLEEHGSEKWFDGACRAGSSTSVVHHWQGRVTHQAALCVCGALIPPEEAGPTTEKSSHVRSSPATIPRPVLRRGTSAPALPEPHAAPTLLAADLQATVPISS